MVIMDDLFGQLTPLDLPLPDGPDFNLDIDLNPKDMLDLEEFDFDFEEINDLGSWIATDSEINNEVNEDNLVASERLNFEDLEIKEAVRYDCMWASYNEFNAQKARNINNNSSLHSTTTTTDPSLNLSSSFYDTLLGSIETPDNSSSDCNSVKSEMETDEDDIGNDKKNHIMQVSTKVEPNSTMSPAHLITSLDHCYNISSTHLDNERFLQKSGPLTPPVSSDDEESSNQNNFTFSSCSNHNRNRNTTTKHRRIITTNNNKTQHTQSILKRPVHRQRTNSEAKFSINLKVNLNKNTDKSRSLLKQKVKIVRTPFINKTASSPSTTDSQLKKKLFEQHRTSQSAMRKRKERSLKMQEGEAREVHNQMERQRRNELKVAFDVLKVHLPEIATSDKASKQQILDKAVETCLSIKTTETSLKSKASSLNKTNSLLKEKLRKLLADQASRKTKFHLGIEDW